VHVKSYAFLAAAAALLLDPAFGQKTPNSNPPAGFQPTPQFVNGKVLLDDGTPPPDTVVIERLCRGIAHTEGHTDRKGAFGFELGHDDLVQDAGDFSNAVVNPNAVRISSDPAADPNRPYRECELRANLPGYRSDVVSLANYRPDGDPNIGAIILHKMGDVEGRVISANTAGAPKNAAKEYEKGMDAVKRGKGDEAAKAFAKAAELHPAFAAAWFELGKLRAAQLQIDAAHKSFTTAVAAEPKFLSPYLELSQLAYRAKNWQELADISGQALKLDPFDYPDLYYLNGLAHYGLKEMDAAEKSFRETEKLDTTHHYPKTHQYLAGILVTKKDLPAAAEELSNYVKYAPNAPDIAAMRRQLRQLQDAARTAGK
jgi:tetratricopeptide (TPR) repeat protein